MTNRTMGMIIGGQARAAAVGNPGLRCRLMTDRKAPRYSGPEFVLKIIDIAGHLGTFGMFILPQGSTPFRYSGAQYYQRVDNAKFEKFFAETGRGLDPTLRFLLEHV